jgi:hypothetical protein
MNHSPLMSAVAVPSTVALSYRVTVLFASAVPVNMGVVSFVILSESDDPESVAEVISGAEGTAGADESIVTDNADEAELIFEAKSMVLAVIE